jgi:hypothetical protein
MSRRNISLLLTGGLLVLLTLTGCTQRDGSPGTPSKAAPVEVRTIEKGDEYVAIGDSYTSAPGTGESTDDCLQTTTNYPHKVAAKLGLKLNDVSCGGAKTTNVTAPQTIKSTTRLPQGNALSASTDLVTVSLGAGDVDVLGIVAFGCTSVRAQDPSGAPCQRADEASGSSTVEIKIDAAERRLVGAIKQVAKRAPDARIVVVGYPEFFPKSGPCTELPLALGDYAFAHRINTMIVRAQKDAAAEANVEYVDVFAASRGHDMCAQDPWIAGLYPTRTDATPLHPFPEEQQLVASLLVDLLS